MEEQMARILVEVLMAKCGKQNPYDALEHILAQVKDAIGDKTVNSLMGNVK